MPTKSHTTNLICDGPGQVRHGVDLVVEGAGNGWPHVDGFVNDWTEWTLDSSENWDALWSSGFRYAFPSVSVTYGAKAANKFAITAWDMAPPTTLAEEWEVWYPYGGDYPSDGNRAKAGEGAYSPPYDRYKALRVDSSDNVWQVTQKDRQTLSVTKKNASNAFIEVETRGVQEWATPKQLTGAVAIYQVSDKLHMAFLDVNGAYRDSDEEWRSYYSCFDMSTESWDVENEAIHTSYVEDYYEGWIDIVVRSTGEVVVFRPGPQTVHGTLTESIATYSRRTGTNTWVSTSWTNTETNWRTAQYPQDTYRMFLGKDDRIHFFNHGYNGSALIMQHRSISSTNVFDNIQNLSTCPHTVQDYASENSMSRVVGSDLYLYYFVVYEVGTLDRQGYYEWKSEANPTVTFSAVADTGGLSDEYGETYGPYGPIVPFNSSDGYLNYFRNEYDLASSNPGDRTHTVSDGIGTYIYTQKTQTDDFDIVRDMLGATQEVRGTVTTGVNWTYPISAWQWPYMMTSVAYFTGITPSYGFAQNFVQSGGLVTIDGSDYVYLSCMTTHTRLNPDAIVVFPLKDTPNVKVKHYTDMVCNPLPISHTSDMLIKAAGSTQTVDQTTDLIRVDRESTSHTSDLITSPKVTQETEWHTTDMLLSQIIDLTVDVSVTFSNIAAYEVVEAADIEVIREGEKLRYGRGKIVRKT